MLTKTIISHFYNEEYLLPWWLNHHKSIFDHGILIDYDSTDNSVEICKNICPHWHIIKSKNKEFCAKEVDDEVSFYESKIDGWKIALNITEFLVGSIDLILNTVNTNQILIPAISFFDWNTNGTLDKNQELWQQKCFGIDYKTNFMLRRARSFHNKNIQYILGRHFHKYNCEDLLIFHYGNCISSQEMLTRRLQIQHRIPKSDKIKNLGFQHHNHGLGLTEEILNRYYNFLVHKNLIQDQSHYISKVCNNVSS